MVDGITGVKSGQSTTRLSGNMNGGKKFKEEIDRLKSIQKADPKKIDDSNNSIITMEINKTNLSSKLMNSDKILKNIFNNLDSGHKKIESILKASLSGVKLNQQELLTLQMRVYRFTQEVELISKLVEKGTSGVKQVVNTQI